MRITYLYDFKLKLTLMVSNGCPDATVQMPPKPPAKKFFVAEVLCFSVILNYKEDTCICKF